MGQRLGWVAAGILGVTMPMAAGAADSLETLKFAVSGGTPNLDLRTRWELADQTGKNDASALLARLRLGYTTGKWNDIDVSGEFEGTLPLAAQTYNSGTNGNTSRALIADPKGYELNQLFVRYSGVPGTVFKLGRQKIILDNARFVGNAGWRMNEQTFDAFNVVNTSIPKTTINYSYLTRVNPPSYSAFKMAGHAFTTTYAQAEWLNVSAYGYLFDFNNNLATRQDTQTYGVRASGSAPLCGIKLLYAAEYARQYGYRDAPSSVKAPYYLAEAGALAFGVNAKLGYEVLGGDGLYGFQTPLATLHVFQGWADQFVNTPAAGIRDRYARLEYTLPVVNVNLIAFYHDYGGDSRSVHYGDEFNMQASYPINPGLSVTAKFADYQKDENVAANPTIDTRRLWLQFDYKF